MSSLYARRRRRVVRAALPPATIDRLRTRSFFWGWNELSHEVGETARRAPHLAKMISRSPERRARAVLRTHCRPPVGARGQDVSKRCSHCRGDGGDARQHAGVQRTRSTRRWRPPPLFGGIARKPAALLKQESAIRDHRSMGGSFFVERGLRSAKRPGTFQEVEALAAWKRRSRPASKLRIEEDVRGQARTTRQHRSWTSTNIALRAKRQIDVSRWTIPWCAGCDRQVRAKQERDEADVRRGWMPDKGAQARQSVALRSKPPCQSHGGEISRR